MGILTPFVGPLCLLAGIFLALYIKDKAREVAKSEVVEGVRVALAIFKNDLVKALDCTYVRSTELTLMFESRDDRLDTYEKAIEALEKVSKEIAEKNIELAYRINVIEKLGGPSREPTHK